MLALAVLSNVTSPAQAGSEDSWPRQPTASATDKHRYIIDVVGKQVRLVGPRFYTNLVGKMNFPGAMGDLTSRTEIDPRPAGPGRRSREALPRPG